MNLYSILILCTIGNLYILGQKNCLIANHTNLVIYFFLKIGDKL